MANTVIINVQANTATATKDITTTTAAVNNLTQSTKKLENANQKTGSSFEDVTKNGGAIAILDQLTGGLASRMRDTFEATKLFNFSLKGMRTAIIATGIGALVVAAALLVSYWDDIVGFFSGATSELEKQKKEYEEINNKSLLKIKLLKHEREIQKKLGKGVEDINKELEKELLVRQKSVALRLKGLKDIHEKTMQQLAEQVKASKDYGLVGSMIQAAEAKYLEKHAEDIEAINTLTADQLAIEQDLASLQSIKIEEKKKEIEENKALAELKKTELEELRVAQIDTQKEIREEELHQSDLKYAALLEKARKYYEEDSIQIKELERLQQDATTELNLKHQTEDREAFLTAEQIKIQDQIDVNNQVIKNAEDLAAGKKVIRDKELADEQAVADAELTIKNASLNSATAALQILAGSDQKNRKLQATMLIATNAVGIAQNIINTKAANARLTVEGGVVGAPALIVANNIRMVTGIAASIAATAKGLSALKAGGSASGAAGASTSDNLPVQQPAFNIVGQGQGNQIATALGQQQQTPIQAFVVSQDVTTAQSLENGIIQGATLGG